MFKGVQKNIKPKQKNVHHGRKRATTRASMPKPYHRPCSRAADNCNIFMPQPYSVVHHVGTHTLTRASVHAQAIPTSIMCRGIRQHRHVCASHKLAHFREHTTGAISTPSPGHARLQRRKLPAGARANMPGVWGGGGST